MEDKYLQPVSNHFGYSNSKLEDVDDNDFLNNSRFRTAATQEHTFNSVVSENTNITQQQQLSYEQRRREIEERSLASTQRSLGLLYDTEEVGNTTAVELAKQREQLERTNKNLDDINATLRYSQRHLNGIKSIFGSLKNYFSGRSEPFPSSSGNVTTSKLSVESHADQLVHNRPTPAVQYDQHPISRIRDDSATNEQQLQFQQAKSKSAFEDQLEANLNEMSDNISRLKGLASELGNEIESQNDLLNNMNYKIEDVDIKIAKQNKDMYKLLGKK